MKEHNKFNIPMFKLKLMDELNNDLSVTNNYESTSKRNESVDIDKANFSLMRMSTFQKTLFLQNPLDEGVWLRGKINVNIINNIQTNSTQINIYNYNDLFKSLPMHSVHNVVKKQMTTTSTHLNNSNHMSSSKPKFELNIRKLMHKNIMDNNESSSERRSTNNFNKHHMKVNSIASSKITETKKGEKSTN